MANSDIEDPELYMQIYVQQIRKCLEDQDVIIPSHCDQFIVRCIRVKKYDVGRAADLVKNFGAMMKLKEMQDIFEKFKPSQLRGLYDSGTAVPLAQRDPHGRLVIVLHAGSWDPSQIDFDDGLAGLIVLFNYATAISEETQHEGVVFIFNFAGLGLKHVRALKITRLRVVLKLLQSSCPGKIKGIHLVNHPKVISMLFTLVKPILKAKLANRIFFHGDEKSLHQVIQPDKLPDHLSGTCGNWNWVNHDLLNDLMHRDAYCQDMVKLGYPSY